MYLPPAVFKIYKEIFILISQQNNSIILSRYFMSNCYSCTNAFVFIFNNYLENKINSIRIAHEKYVVKTRESVVFHSMVPIGTYNNKCIMNMLRNLFINSSKLLR